MKLTWNETDSNKCDGVPRLNPSGEVDGCSKEFENLFQQSERNGG